MTVDLDAGRVALLTPQGPPVRGDIDTDLGPRGYTLTVDRERRQWVFGRGQVRTGLRFGITLDTAEPFALSYPAAFPLTVHRGFPPRGAEALPAVRGRLRSAVADRRWGDAYGVLDLLPAVDLYDLLDAVWLDDPGVVNELLLRFGEVPATAQYDRLLIVRALESFAVKPEKLLADAFDACYVHPASFARDVGRERAGLSTLQLVFTYDLVPARAIRLHADDILDTTGVPPDPPRYGAGELLHPAWYGRSSTPRMWEAKHAKIAEVEAQNAEFFATAYAAVETTTNLVLLAGSLLTSTVPAAAGGARRFGNRPVSDTLADQPGRWMPDFEGGTNMTKEAAAYQSRVCHADPGLGYYRNGVQFDGYDSGALIDAKFYLDESGMARALVKESYWAGWKALDTATRQLEAAQGIPVEWRVAGRAATGKLTELFKTHQLPIKVVHVP